MVQAETVRAEGIEDFKSEIKKRVLRKPEPVKKVDAFVFVDMESVDRGLAEKVCSILVDQEVGYRIPDFSGAKSPAEIRRKLDQSLRQCTAIIIIYGSSTVTWVNGQLEQCLKSFPKRQTLPNAIAVFECPPEDKQPPSLGLPHMKTLNFRRGIDEAELVKFVKSLREGGA